jgi:hypothetical protein
MKSPPLGLRIARSVVPKLLALLLGFAVYAFVKSEREQAIRVRAPIETAGLPPGLVVDGPLPADALVELRARGRDLVKLRLRGARVRMDLAAARPGEVQRALSAADLSLPEDVRVSLVRFLEPEIVSLAVDSMITEGVPVRLALVGELPDTVGLAEPMRPEPAEVQVSGPSRRVRALDAIPTEPLWLEGLLTEPNPVVEVVAPEGVRVRPASVRAVGGLLALETRVLPPLLVLFDGQAPGAPVRVTPDSARVTVLVPQGLPPEDAVRATAVRLDLTDLLPGTHLLTPSIGISIPTARVRGVEPLRFEVLIGGAGRESPPGAQNPR